MRNALRDRLLPHLNLRLFTTPTMRRTRRQVLHDLPPLSQTERCAKREAVR